MKKTYLILFVAVVTGLIVGFLILNGKNNQSSQDQSVSTSQTTASSSTESNSSSQQVAATITYTNSGFSPEKITVKSGDMISVKNDSSRPLEFSSDPHPVHTDDPELNQSVLEPGQSQSFTLTTKGTWGYHDHLNEINTGTIVVE